MQGTANVTAIIISVGYKYTAKSVFSTVFLFSHNTSRQIPENIKLLNCLALEKVVI